MKVKRLAEVVIATGDAAKTAGVFSENFELPSEGKTLLRVGSTLLRFVAGDRTGTQPAILDSITLEADNLTEVKHKLSGFDCQIVEEEEAGGRLVLVIEGTATHGLRLKIRQAERQAG